MLRSRSARFSVKAAISMPRAHKPYVLRDMSVILCRKCVRAHRDCRPERHSMPIVALPPSWSTATYPSTRRSARVRIHDYCPSVRSCGRKDKEAGQGSVKGPGTACTAKRHPREALALRKAHRGSYLSEDASPGSRLTLRPWAMPTGRQRSTLFIHQTSGRPRDQNM
jgi:hypothetical protein